MLKPDGEVIEIKAKFSEDVLPVLELDGGGLGRRSGPARGLWARDSEHRAGGAEGKRRLCTRAAAGPLPRARSWWARQELAAKANQQNSHQEPSEAGVTWPSAFRMLRAPLLAFQPPHLSPFPCWALARCPSHVSAWESPPAFSFNAAESLGSWLHGASSGLPVRGLSSTCGTAEPVAVGVCTLLAIPPQGLDVPRQPAGPENTGSARQPGALLAQALPCHLSRPMSGLQAWGAPWWPDYPTA